MLRHLIGLICLLVVINPAFSCWFGGQSAAPVKRARGCYLSSWAQHRSDRGSFTVANYEPGLCSHLFYAFVVMSANNEVITFEANDEKAFADLVNIKQQQPDLKLILSLGGSKFSSEVGGNALMKKMAASDTTRATFVKSVVTFVRRIKFDGFDLDWEYPDAGDKVGYAALLKEMRAAFDDEAKTTGKPRLLLTALVSGVPAKVDAGFDGAIGQSVDFFNVMTYNLHGYGFNNEKVTGFNSPLVDRNGEQLSIASAVKKWTDVGVPAQKLLIGLASFGRGFNLASATNFDVGAAATGASAKQKYTQLDGYASYYEVCDLIDKSGYKVNYDEKQQSAYAVGNGVWIGYDNVQSLNAKLDWVIKGNYGGVFLWALDMDDFQNFCSSSQGKKYPLMNAIKAKIP